MLIHALVATIGAHPEPAVLLVLDGLDEKLAHLLGGRARIAMLAENNIAQFRLIPVVHSILLLGLFFFIVARVSVQIFLGGLALDVQVVTELALLALLAVALFVENA